MKALSLAAIFLAKAVAGLTAAEWRSQSIYFLLTDRFGRADNSTTATCNVSDRVGFYSCYSMVFGIFLIECNRSTVVAAGRESSITYAIPPLVKFHALLRLC